MGGICVGCPLPPVNLANPDPKGHLNALAAVIDAVAMVLCASRGATGAVIVLGVFAVANAICFTLKQANSL